MEPKLYVAVINNRSKKDILALVQLHDWARTDKLPIKGLRDKRVKRVIYKEKKFVASRSDVDGTPIEPLAELIRSRPLAWQAAEARGWWCVRFYIRSLVRELMGM